MEKVTQLRLKTDIEVFLSCLFIFIGLGVILVNFEDGIYLWFGIFLSASALFNLVRKICEVLRN